MERRGVVSLGIIASSVLLALFFLSPLINPSGSFYGLDGSPTAIDHGWNGIRGLGYTIGDILCHQELDRCFIYNGNQMPICIRDTGLLTGLICGLMMCLMIGHRVSDRRSLFIGLVMVAVTGVEWVLEIHYGDIPGFRFSSGIVSGIGAAFVLCWVLYRDQEETGRQYA